MITNNTRSQNDETSSFTTEATGGKQSSASRESPEDDIMVFRTPQSSKDNVVVLEKEPQPRTRSNSSCQVTSESWSKTPRKSHSLMMRSSSALRARSSESVYNNARAGGSSSALRQRSYESVCSNVPGSNSGSTRKTSRRHSLSTMESRSRPRARSGDSVCSFSLMQPRKNKPRRTSLDAMKTTKANGFPGDPVCSFAVQKPRQTSRHSIASSRSRSRSTELVCSLSIQRATTPPRTPRRSSLSVMCSSASAMDTDFLRDSPKRPNVERTASKSVCRPRRASTATMSSNFSNLSMNSPTKSPRRRSSLARCVSESTSSSRRSNLHAMRYSSSRGHHSNEPICSRTHNCTPASPKSQQNHIFDQKQVTSTRSARNSHTSGNVHHLTRSDPATRRRRRASLNALVSPSSADVHSRKPRRASLSRCASANAQDGGGKAEPLPVDEGLKKIKSPISAETATFFQQIEQEMAQIREEKRKQAADIFPSDSKKRPDHHAGTSPTGGWSAPKASHARLDEKNHLYETHPFLAW